MLLYYVSSSVKLPSQGLSINRPSPKTAHLYDKDKGSLDPSKTHQMLGKKDGCPGSLSLQFTERLELSVFVTNSAQNPKDALKHINYVDFVAQRTTKHSYPD